MKIINDFDMTHLNWSHAVSKDSLRPVMTGVFFDLENDVMVGTDSHTLLIVPCTCEVEQTESYWSVEQFNDLKKKQSKIVPIEFFNKNKYMGDWKSYCFDIKYDLSDDDYAQVWNGPEVVFRCRYIEGKFPNYKAVIPEESQPMSELNIDFNFIEKIKKMIPTKNKSVKVTLHGERKPISFKHKDFNIKGLISQFT